MPIYEFKCLACQAEFDELCAMGATAKCPHCASANTQKKYPSFQRKVAEEKEQKAYLPATPVVLAMDTIVVLVIKMFLQ